jgi:RecA-family ATPase
MPPLNIQSYEALVAHRLQPPKSIIGNGILLATTKLILYGAPKTFKSLLTQQLCFCLGVGIPWVGFSTTPSKVLYIQAEISRFPFRMRLIAMGRNQQVPPQQIFFATEFGLKLDRSQGMADLTAALDKVQPEILVIDPLYKFMTSSDEAAIQHTLDFLDLLIEKKNLTIIVVHHSRKPRASATGQIVDMGGAEIRGPLLEQWADSLVRLQGDINTDFRTMEFELRNATTLVPPIDIEFERNRVWFRRV